MSNLLTDRNFWTRYWESKPDLAFTVPRDYLFHEQLGEIVRREKPQTAIELGGFPGYYTIFLKKYFAIDSTLFDYFVHPGILHSVLAKNNLTEKDISIIESDLFEFTPEKQYDLVLSCGLIEHFEDTKDIIARHLNFLKPGGTLFITLPNFKSVNGWVQKTFDKENYLKHNIKCMDPALLEGILTDLNMEVRKAGYWGRYSVWLENKREKSLLVKVFIKTIWFAGKIATRIVPVESQSLSPYIMLEATKR
jgi:SAM-dependent methyltransferase